MSRLPRRTKLSLDACLSGLEAELEGAARGGYVLVSAVHLSRALRSLKRLRAERAKRAS